MTKSILLAILILLSGCATPAYKQILKEEPISNSREFAVSRHDLFQATAEALSKKNFILEEENEEKGFILGKRAVPRGRKNIVLLVQGKIFDGNQNASVLYLNAVETTETSYVSDHTRFFMFILPLPGGGGKQASTAKEGEKTIQDKKFYSDFFRIIEDIIAAKSINPANGSGLILSGSEVSALSNPSVSENKTEEK